jgi:MoxR-like ATPase
MQAAVERVHVSEAVGRYVVALVSATRSARGVAVGASPRGSLAVMKLARVRAALDGRRFAVPDDVKAVAVPALAHRLTLRPELWTQSASGEEIIGELLGEVAVPRADPDA